MPELLRRFADRTKRAAAALAAPPSPEPVTTSRERNLFDAAAAYVTACTADDQDRIDAAARRVAPDALMSGVTELRSARGTRCLTRSVVQPSGEFHRAPRASSSGAARSPRARL
jgi:hypothetical protein